MTKVSRIFGIIIFTICIIFSLVFKNEITKYISTSLGYTSVATSTLEVISLGGDMKIYIDGVENGIVRESQDKYEVPNLTPGVHRVQLSRIADIEYPKLDLTLDFLASYATTVAYEIGPSEAVSQGWVVEPVENSGTDNFIEVTPNIDATAINIASRQTGKSLTGVDNKNVYNIDYTSGYTVLVEKDGYLPLTFDLFNYGDTDATRTEKLKKVNFEIKTYSFELPMKVNYI